MHQSIYRCDISKYRYVEYRDIKTYIVEISQAFDE